MTAVATKFLLFALCVSYSGGVRLKKKSRSSQKTQLSKGLTFQSELHEKGSNSRFAENISAPVLVYQNTEVNKQQLEAAGYTFDADGDVQVNTFGSPRPGTYARVGNSLVIAKPQETKPQALATKTPSKPVQSYPATPQNQQMLIKAGYTFDADGDVQVTTFGSPRPGTFARVGDTFVIAKQQESKAQAAAPNTKAYPATQEYEQMLTKAGYRFDADGDVQVNMFGSPRPGTYARVGDTFVIAKPQESKAKAAPSNTQAYPATQEYEQMLTKAGYTFDADGDVQVNTFGSPRPGTYARVGDTFVIAKK